MSAAVSENELQRVIHLSELDLNYSELKKELSHLALLASRITGIRFSHINLIDSLTQWTVAYYGLEAAPIDREDSICTFTIEQIDDFEVPDLTMDDRFKNKAYVTGGEHLKYYYGIPLETTSGYNIGALCVLDPDLKQLDPEQKQLLKIIADEVVNRIQYLSEINKLKTSLEDLVLSRRKLSHDIRGPISGIIGLTGLIEEELANKEYDSIPKLTQMLKTSGRSILELTDSILSGEQISGKEVFSAETLSAKLRELYEPQAATKSIQLEFKKAESGQGIDLTRFKLLHILGNLISNSIKFTPVGGKVGVIFHFHFDEANRRHLQIEVTDNGIGMDEHKIRSILEGTSTSTSGTSGERGYGMGLYLVKHLVDKSGGKMDIQSEPSVCTRFEISFPL